MAIRGTCLCGTVAFVFEPSQQYGVDRVMGVCHCARCQRWGSGCGWPFVVVAPERFRVVSGEDRLALYRDDAGRLRMFCRHCGSHLYEDTGGPYHVAAGALHDLVFAPTFELSPDDRAPWDKNAPDGDSTSRPTSRR